MAGRSVSAQVSPRFGAASGFGTLQLVIEETGDDVFGSGEGIEFFSANFGWRALRIYPAVGPTVVASRGEVEYVGTTVQNDRDEYIIFSGGETASTRYPIDEGTLDVVEIAFAFDGEGNELNFNDLSFSGEAQRSTIRCNRSIFGAIRVRYAATAQIYRYRAAVVEGNVSGYTAALRNFGTVLAFKDGAAVTLDIEPPGFTEETSGNGKELYRIVSQVQVNANGAWEKHPDFDTGGFWNDNSPQQGGEYFEYERVHELGYLRETGAGLVDRDTRNVQIEQGPSGSFTPAYEARFRPASEFIGTEFQDAYTRLALTQIKDQIRQRFGNIPGL